jgi:3-methyladenine DNA glycosylase AlkD
MRGTESSKTYVGRVAPVSLIQSTRTFRVTYDMDEIFLISERLKHDEEIVVKKGGGGLLKYAYLTIKVKCIII